MRLRAGDPARFAGRLREITTALDPTLRLNQMRSLKDVYRLEQMGLHWGALVFSLVTLSVLVLSAGSAVMTVVGLLAALGLARRVLRIQPTEALRAE